MSQGTSIEWTEATWNPTTGCDRVSPGCDNCYAMSLAKRLKAMGNPRYQKDGRAPSSGPGFGVTLHPDKLGEPNRWREPRRVFVNSMSDLFHADIPKAFIADVFETMSKTSRHTYQILTKRPARMRSVVRWLETEVAGARGWLWPLPNVWLGVSVEDQEHADKRIPLLLDTPAAVRWLSCEPLLGPIDFDACPAWGPGQNDFYLEDIAWVVVGGESGHGHRPLDPAWVRQLRDQCLEAGVAYFLKQWGGRTPKAGGRELDGRTWDEYPSSLGLVS